MLEHDLNHGPQKQSKIRQLSFTAGLRYCHPNDPRQPLDQDDVFCDSFYGVDDARFDEKSSKKVNRKSSGGGVKQMKTKGERIKCRTK